MKTVVLSYNFIASIFSRTRLFENLRMLPHAPGVQMADIPPDGLGAPLKDESAAADEADPDKRNPNSISDKTTDADNEFEEGKSSNKDNVNNGSKEEPMDTSDAAATATAAAAAAGDAAKEESPAAAT
jgi:histone deacetylase 1/2